MIAVLDQVIYLTQVDLTDYCILHADNGDFLQFIQLQRFLSISKSQSNQVKIQSS